MSEFIEVVTQLPNELCPAFMEWCVRGDHKIEVKKDRVLIRKNGKKGEIYCKRGHVQPSYPMNDYMVERFKLFSLQWLKHGKDFVTELDSSMIGKYNEAVRHVNLWRVAA